MDLTDVAGEMIEGPLMRPFACSLIVALPIIAAETMACLIINIAGYLGVCLLDIMNLT